MSDHEFEALRRAYERFDAEALNDADIYPTGWGTDTDRELEWLLSHYDELRAYYANAAAARDAMLLSIR